MSKSRFGLWVILLVLLSGMGYVTFMIFGHNYYNIKFDSNGGSKVASLKVKKEEILNSLPFVDKEGYEFVGWYLEEDLYDLNIPIKSDITLKAKWIEKEDEEHIIKFDSLGGEKIEDIKVGDEEIIQVVPEPTKEGYKFVGWYYHNKTYDFNKPITSDLILIAKYRKIS